jgi:hypothetical protein
MNNNSGGFLMYFNAISLAESGYFFKNPMGIPVFFINGSSIKEMSTCFWKGLG